MSEVEKCKLIFKSKEHEIPSQFRSLVEAKPDIQEAIKTQHQYIVKSDVSEEVFKSYVANWISRDAPDINDENVEEYRKLSEEFGAMRDVVELYTQLTASSEKLIEENKELEKQIEEVSQEIEQKTNLYHQIYQYLFNNSGIDSHERFIEVKDKLYKACQDENLKLVALLTQKEARVNGLSFSLNEKDMTTCVLENLSATGDVVIPRSVEHENQEYIVTSIVEGSFKGCDQIKTVKFQDSQLQVIEKDSFTESSLQNISIPPSVSKIEEGSFARCAQLQQVIIPENSKLKLLEEASFPECPQLKIIIPNQLKESLQIQFSNENLIQYV